MAPRGSASSEVSRCPSEPSAAWWVRWRGVAWRRWLANRVFGLSWAASLLLHGAAGCVWLGLGTARFEPAVMQLSAGELAMLVKLGDQFDAVPAPAAPTPATTPTEGLATPSRLEPASFAPPDERLEKTASVETAPVLAASLETRPPERVSENEPKPVLEPLTHDRAEFAAVSASRERPVAPPPPRPESLTRPAPAAPAAPPAAVAGQAGDRRSIGARQRAAPQGGFTPYYPETARRRGESGVVLVMATISAQGICSSAAVMRSSGYPTLDGAALAAVQQARFSPARENGFPVAVQDRFEIVFQLN